MLPYCFEACFCPKIIGILWRLIVLSTYTKWLQPTLNDFARWMTFHARLDLRVTKVILHSLIFTILTSTLLKTEAISVSINTFVTSVVYQSFFNNPRLIGTNLRLKWTLIRNLFAYTSKFGTHKSSGVQQGHYYCIMKTWSQFEMGPT